MLACRWIGTLATHAYLVVWPVWPGCVAMKSYIIVEVAVLMNSWIAVKGALCWGGFRFWGLGTLGVLDRPCRRRLTLREV